MYSNDRPNSTDDTTSRTAYGSTLGQGTASTDNGLAQPSQVADQVRQQAGQVADQVREQAGQVADQVRQQAGQVASQTQEQVRTQLNTQKDQASESLGSVAQTVRQIGTQLRQNDTAAPLAQYTDTAANQIENASQYLRTHDVNTMMGDLEQVARRQPALFIGGAFALGLLAARFLKSTSSNS